MHRTRRIRTSARPRVVAEPLEKRRLLTVFTLDANASFLRLAGSLDAGDFEGDLDVQEDNTDTARLSGTVSADFTSKGLRVRGSTRVVTGDTNVPLDPGNAEADFAFQAEEEILGQTVFEASVALRDLTFTFVSPRVPIKQGKTFAGAKLRGEVVEGSFDYGGDLGDGSIDMAGISGAFTGGRGKVTGSGGSRSLRIPIGFQLQVDVDGDVATLDVTGRIVAHSGNHEGQIVSVQRLTEPKARPFAPVGGDVLAGEQNPSVFA